MAGCAFDALLLLTGFSFARLCCAPRLSLLFQVCLGFHEKVQKPKSFLSWGGKSEEKVFWERWIVPIRCDSFTESSGAAAGDATASAGGFSAPSPLQLLRRARLSECLTYLVFRCNEKREHIPPLKASSTAALAFSFELSFTVGGKKDDSWGTQFTKLLSMTPPILKLQ